jgi:hypothetical protein
MSADLSVQDVKFIPKPMADKLRALEIRTLRQLAARLEADREPLRDYLGLNEREFEGLRLDTTALVEREFPEERRSWPRVNKRGVAVHRLQEAKRPRFQGDRD